MAYNPFDTSIGDALTASDLQLLITRSVSEGYYVEYKGEMVTHEKIAKSVASFANTYGGWYFIGVEADRQNNVVTNICGFDRSICADPISKVRDVVKSHITPVPVFFPQIVTLSANLLVLVVYIPGEQDTPFITKDGRIYRREADSSVPVSEKDRYAVDRLIDQGQKNAERFERFCRDTRTFAKSEEGGWLNITLSPYPSGLINKFSMLYPTENFHRLFQRSKNPLDLYINKKTKVGNATLGFSSAQLTTRSVILRDIDPKHVAFHSSSLELFVDGSAKLFLQFPHFDISPQGRLSTEIQSSKVRETLRNFNASSNASDNLPFEYTHFFNIGTLLKMMYLYLNFYIDWLGSDGSLVSEFKTAFRLQKVWRCVPFLDMDEWGNHVEQFGLPILLCDAISVPDEPGKGYIVNVEEDIYDLWRSLASDIGMACGLTAALSGEAFLGTILNLQRIPPDWKLDWK